jgi:DHA2 family multidrug resistance protein
MAVINSEQENSVRTNIITLAVMLSALMVLIDMTIANVSLPYMMGELGATSDQITWVLTAYAMAEAIFIPLTSYFVARLGVRKLFIVAIVGFMVASALCGQAQTIEEMVLFRIIQGALGASIIPMAQSTLIRVHGEKNRGKAMAIFSIGILLGPILGPVLGGLITGNMNWRWIFYINIPIGMLCLSLIFRYLHFTDKHNLVMDWTVVIPMAIGIAALQFFLDMGNEEDWFHSLEIVIALLIAIVGIGTWVFRSFKTRSSAAPIWVMQDRNLLVAASMMAVVSMAMFGMVSQQPMMLERLLQYPAETAGLLMAPRGLASALVLILVIKLNPQFDPRYKILFGLLSCASGTYLMTFYSANIDIYWIVMPSIVQGMGLGLVFSTLSSIAYTTVKPENTVAAASMFNLWRTIGSSIGISLTTAYQFRVGQEEWNQLSSAINPYNPNMLKWSQVTGLDMQSPEALMQLQSQLLMQSQLVSYVHVFALVLLGFVITIPLLGFFKMPKT